MVSIQKTAPTNTRTKAYLAYGAGAEEEEQESAPLYEQAHVKTMAALPSASGALSDETMLMYLTEEASCNVAYILEMFTQHQRHVTHIRIIGAGFVSVTFCSEFTCAKARDQVRQRVSMSVSVPLQHPCLHHPCLQHPPHHHASCMFHVASFMFHVYSTRVWPESWPDVLTKVSNVC